MTADDSQASRDVAAGGHGAPLADATGPTAAAAFAGHILSKYFVAPVVRRGPSLVLRMLQTPGRGDGPGAMKSAAADSSTPTDAPARPAVRIALAADRRSAAPSSGRSAVRVPDLSRPAPVSASRSLVQRKPLVGAASEMAAPGADRRETRANKVMPPVAGHGILARRPGNAGLGAVAQTGAAVASNISTNSVLSGQAPASAHADPLHVASTALRSTAPAPAPTVSAGAGTGTPPYATSHLGSGLLRRVPVPGPHRLVQRKSLTLRSADAQAAAVVSRSSGVTPVTSAPDRAAGRAPAPTASVGTSAGAAPYAPSRLGSGLLRRGPVPGLHRLVQRKSLAWRSADTPAAAVVSRSSGVRPVAPAAGHAIAATSSLSSGIPPSIDPGRTSAPDGAAGRAPAPTASVGASAGTAPYALSRLGSGLLRRVPVPGLHRLAQRKSLAWRSADTPAAAVVARSSGVEPAAAAGHAMAAASSLSSSVQPSSIDTGQPWLATFARLRPLAQRKPPAGRGADAVIGASAFTATPIGDGMRLFTPTMPWTSFAYGRGAFPDGRAAPPVRRRPARVPMTYRPVLDRPSPAELERSHDVDIGLQAPTMTHRLDAPAAPLPAAGARPMAAELTLRSSSADVKPVPTVVAATLGVAAPAPAPQHANKVMESNQASTVSSMPIQMLADRVFRILERRLVVERERRGIRL